MKNEGASIKGQGKFLSTESGTAYQPLALDSYLKYQGKPNFPVHQGTLELIVSDMGIAVPTTEDPTLVHFHQNDNRQVVLRLNAGRLQFIVYAWAGSWITARKHLPLWDLKTPHHIAVVWRENQAKLFVDGKEIAVRSRGKTGRFQISR